MTRIAVVAAGRRSGASARSRVADTLLNIPPPGSRPATWKKPFEIEVIADAAGADACSHPGGSAA